MAEEDGREKFMILWNKNRWTNRALGGGWGGVEQLIGVGQEDYWEDCPNGEGKGVDWRNENRPMRIPSTMSKQCLFFRLITTEMIDVRTLVLMKVAWNLLLLLLWTLLLIYPSNCLSMCLPKHVFLAILGLRMATATSAKLRLITQDKKRTWICEIRLTFLPSCSRVRRHCSISTLSAKRGQYFNNYRRSFRLGRHAEGS